MFLSGLLAFLVLIAILEVLLRGLFLRIASRWLRISDVTYRRATGVALAITLALYAILAVYFAGTLRWPPEEPGHELFAVASTVLFLFLIAAVPWSILKRHLRTTWLKALAAGLIAIVLADVVSVGTALVVRRVFYEAFVVPTGAMGPTIYGVHADVRGANCGAKYAVNLSQRLLGPSPEPIDSVCWNCRQAVSIPPTTRMVPGDRVLGEKIGRPSRGDLVVFKSPEDNKTNFIKRLVGVPGEHVEILDGDLFVEGQRLVKSPDQMSDLWLPVSDSRHVPRTALPDGPGWKPERATSAWRAGDGNWTFSGPEAETQELAFAGTLTDAISYNGTEPRMDPLMPPVRVGDIKLECRVEHFSGTGTLGFRWAFRGQEVSVSISPGGDVAFHGWDRPGGLDAQAEGIYRASGRLTSGLAAGSQVGFAFRDGHAYVLDGSRIVASTSVGPQDSAIVRARQNGEPKPCHLAIVADHCTIRLSNLRLFKDLYYRDSAEMEYAGMTKDMITSSWQLGPDQYLVLGDNSARSKDSRMYGPIRRTALIGQVRAIYWPPSRWRSFETPPQTK